MTKSKDNTFTVEGPDWRREVEVNSDIYTDEIETFIEAGTLGIESEWKARSEIKLGPIVIVKKKKGNSKEAMVNAYKCLINASQFKLAEKLRGEYKDQTGQDLALDETGVSF